MIDLNLLRIGCHLSCNIAILGVFVSNFRRDRFYSGFFSWPVWEIVVKVSFVYYNFILDIWEGKSK